MTPDHPKINYGKTGILIVNLGTPDSTSWLDIRKYLKEFLSDRRVIEVNPLIWQVILNLFILTFRPSKTAKAYKEIWMKDKNMSPLRYFTERQAEKLFNKIGNEDLIVDFAVLEGLKVSINKLSITCQIKGLTSITRLSDKNSFKYFLISNQLVESGVPRLTIKIPVLPKLIFG